MQFILLKTILLQAYDVSEIAIENAKRNAKESKAEKGHFILVCFAAGEDGGDEVDDYEFYRSKQAGVAFTEERLRKFWGEKFDVTDLRKGENIASVHNGIPLSYLLMAFTDINNEKTRYLIAQRKEWLLGLLRKGWITGKLSNGKISEGDSYNLMGKYIIRNAIGTLQGYEDISEHKIYINKKDERCYCDI